jgi:hypothetical protein
MKRRAILTAVTVAAIMTIVTEWPSESIPGIWTTVKARHQGCSNVSLKGTYAYLRTGTNAALGGPIAIIGTAGYDGQGNFTGGREAASRNGEIADWIDLPPGSTYAVDPDCTGSAFDLNGNKTANLVVTDNGNGFLLISALTGRTITATGKRLELED